MNRRKMGLAVFAGITFVAAGVMSGCSGDGKPEEHGTLRVPLSTQAPSGATYRLRDATFEISSDYYYYDDSYPSEGGAGGTPQLVTVSSEVDPDATSISVSVENGYKYVRLRPGWRMEKVEDGAVTDVEATLLSSATQWVYVSPRATSWVDYQFGIGERAIWFNGDLNLQIQVYEKPSDLYGGGGESAGTAGVGGTP